MEKRMKLKHTTFSSYNIFRTSSKPLLIVYELETIIQILYLRRYIVFFDLIDRTHSALFINWDKFLVD